MILKPKVVPYPEAFNSDAEFNQFWETRERDWWDFRALIPTAKYLDIDLSQNLLTGVDDHQQALYYGYCRFLLSYSKSKQDVLMGWANRSIQAKSTISPLNGYLDHYEQISPEIANNIALSAASSVGADFVVFTETEDLLMFYAINDVASVDLYEFDKTPNFPRLIAEIEFLISTLEDRSMSRQDLIIQLNDQVAKWFQQANVYSPEEIQTNRMVGDFVSELNGIASITEALTESLEDQQSLEIVISVLKGECEAVLKRMPHYLS